MARFARRARWSRLSRRRYYYADQYSNDENWRAHYRTTANEIWEQTEGQVTHFVAALGTSGTFMGTTRRLKELNPKIQCVSMQPDSPFNGLEGLKHMATAIVPKIYDPKLADQNIEMATERAYEMAKFLGRSRACWLAFRPRRLRQRRCNRRGGSCGGTRGGDRDDPVRRRGQVYERTLLAGRRSNAMLRIDYADYEALRAHGEETYPHECCGVLLGKSEAELGIMCGLWCGREIRGRIRRTTATTSLRWS